MNFMFVYNERHIHAFVRQIIHQKKAYGRFYGKGKKSTRINIAQICCVLIKFMWHVMY